MVVRLALGVRSLRWRAHNDVIRALTVTPDGKHVVSCSDDMTIKLWELDSGSHIASFEGHKSRVLSVAVSPDGKILASAGFGYSEASVRIWALESGASLDVLDLSRSNYAPLTVTFSPDGARLLVGATAGLVLVYRLSRMIRRALQKPTKKYVNAKVVLVGESGVGKTTLAYRLVTDRYVKVDSTHGMNVWRLNLPLEKNSNMVREAVLWDFAGQEDYRLIHQLYLQETSIALLLINPQKDDPFTEAGDWLKALRAAVTAKDSQRDVAKLLILTRSDVGGLKVSQRKIDRFLKEHGILACLATSARRGDNCSDHGSASQASELKQLIARLIQWDKLPWTSTPRLLEKIKNALIAMRDEADIRLLRFAELFQRLEQSVSTERFEEADVRTAVTLLANHGLVRPLKFGDLVLLRPDLLNGYASAIIRSARAHKDEIGCVPEEAIYREDFDFTGVERLKHRPDEELLLRALVQTLLHVRV